MVIVNYIKLLEQLSPCSRSLDWLYGNAMYSKEAWDKCDKPEWIIWLSIYLRGVTEDVLELLLRYFPEGDRELVRQAWESETRYQELKEVYWLYAPRSAGSENGETHEQPNMFTRCRELLQAHHNRNRRLAANCSDELVRSLVERGLTANEVRAAVSYDVVYAALEDTAKPDDDC
jgi:hypothetical protein